MFVQLFKMFSWRWSTSLFDNYSKGGMQICVTMEKIWLLTLGGIGMELNIN